MPDNEILLYEKRDPHIAIITLNRPEKKNAMSSALGDALKAAWVRARDDDDVWSIILTGSGDSFCAGGDLAENIARARGELPARPRSHTVVGDGSYVDLRSLNLVKPVIAAINGYCVGGGFGLALACDIRYCVPAAKFGCSEVRWSHMAAWPTYMRTIPLGWGMWFALTGQMVNADTAFRLGLIQQICEPDKLLDDCIELATTINNNGKLVAQHTKEYVQRSLYEIEGWGASFAMHSLYYGHLRSTKDYDEGSAAFTEKRDPEFGGK